MGHVSVEADTIYYSPAPSAWKGQEWQLVLGLLSSMGHASMEADTINYSPAISA